jgi:hypothetical protein
MSRALRIGISMILVAGAAALSGPAHAKVGLAVKAAALTGPGIDKPIRFGPEDFGGGGAGDVIAGQTSLFERLAYAYEPEHFDGAPPDATAPHGAELGPRYEVVYEARLFGDANGGGGSTVSVTQHVYPFAEGRPYVFYPGGQALGNGVELTSGWLRTNDLLTANLIHYGLPNRAEAPAAGRRGEAAGPALAWWTVAGLVMLAALVLAGGAVLVSRRMPLLRSSS